MYTLEEIITMQGKIASDSHGESVFEKIKETVKDGDGKGRWFWELLQNAMDAVEQGEKVAVELIINEDKVLFKHNGNPFQLEEILKLITQGSSKKEATHKRGRFGTGFISTYLLSRQVWITGMLESNTRFSFLLDREADSIARFIEKQQKCVVDFWSSLDDRDRQAETSFSYLLDDTGREHAVLGIEQVDKIIPFVMAFNEKLDSIKIDYNGRVALYERGDEERFDAIERSIIIVNKGEYQCAVLKKRLMDQWQMAYKLDYINGSLAFADLLPDFPNLFLSFPLLGTDALGLPVVIHSELFDVKERRDSIFLGTGSNPDIVRNKEVIESAVYSIPDMLQWAIEHNVGRMYNAIHFRATGPVQGIDVSWLSLLKVKALEAIKDIPIMAPFSAGSPISVEQSFIPFNDSAELRNKLYDLGLYLFCDIMPPEPERDAWYPFCLAYKEIMKVEKVMPEFFLTFQALCYQIQTRETYSELKEQVSGGKLGVDDWLASVYATIVAAGEMMLFKEHAIIPTQAGSLSKQVGGLRMDGVLDEVLVDIAVIQMPDLLTRLVPANIVLPDGLCEALTKRELVGQLATYFSGLVIDAYDNENIQRANAKFLKWLISAGEREHINSFQVICFGEEKGQDMMYKRPLAAYADKKQKILAPIMLWEDEYPHFAEMVRERDTLSGLYGEILSPADFAFLQEMGLIYVKPLVSFRESATQPILQRLLRDQEQLSSLVDNEKVVLDEEIEYTDFAFLGSSDDQILSSVSVSNSARILAFVLQEAVERDKAFDMLYTVNGIEGTPVTLMKAGWVGRLRNNSWVSVKKEGDSSGASGERPSSQNLANLIKSKPELKPLIRTEKAAKIFSMWGVSISDLIRNLMPDEAVKAAWDRTFTALLLSDVDPVMASEMLADKRFRDQYESMKKQGERIRENQNIGAKLETAFNNLFQRPQYKHLKVLRKPFGSDYEMVPDMDLLNADGKEELLEIGAWLIELKATTRAYAAMTELQGETAVANKDNYALVVLELDGSDITEASIISGARFVTNIGYRLEGKYNEVVTLQERQGAVRTPTDDLEVFIEGEQLRYHVQKRVWREGKTLEEFLEMIAGRRSKK